MAAVVGVRRLEVVVAAVTQVPGLAEAGEAMSLLCRFQAQSWPGPRLVQSNPSDGDDEKLLVWR